MADETQTFTTNQDGTFNIQLDGKPTRLVKESDLLVVKGASETARKEYETNVATYQSQIATANQSKDETHQQLLQERAAKEQLETQAKESATQKERVGELETQLTAASEGRKQFEDELLGRVKASLATEFKVSEDTIKDKDLPQLRTMETALREAGIKPGGVARYDLGGGAGGAPGATSVIEGAKQELAFAREQQKKRAAGDTDYNP